MSSHDRALRALARSYGVQMSFTDVRGRVRRASPDSLVQVVKSLGADIDSAADAPDALGRRLQEVKSTALDPVLVAWDGRTPALTGRRDGLWRLRTEDGTTREVKVRSGESVDLGSLLPMGYHDLEVESNGGTERTRIISAPRRAPAPRARTWGVFAPAYAVHSDRTPRMGDLTDLETLLRWTAKLGGSLLATLPLFATFLDDPFEPSPYSPITRLFLNEVYVDPERTPEWERSGGVGGDVGDEADGASLVAHGSAYAAKRRVLEALAETFFAGDGGRRLDDLHRLLNSDPHLLDYAAFRAQMERDKQPPQGRAPREGIPQDPIQRYHLYAQLVAHEQVAGLNGTEPSGGLQLDLPVGVHGAGFDLWRFPDAFVGGIDAGAPPDDFFEGGQNWGFAPLHPLTTRRDGHAYFSQVLRKLARYSAVMRIDHVMGLHRMYWIPHGSAAVDGVYVRYPTEELYAVVNLEAHRADTVVVGEDLGTVPGAVRAELRRRRILSTYVLQFETTQEADEPLNDPGPNDLACVNTHDMPPFAAWWKGLEAEQRSVLVAYLKRRGFLDPGGPQEPDTTSVVAAALRFLAAGEAKIALANLEDLWGEARPQNVPGTTHHQHPNWRRKMARSIAEITSDPAIGSVLSDVARLRSKEA